MISWLVTSLCFAVMASLTIWARRPTLARPLAVFALLFIVPASGALLLTARGWAAPIVPYLTDLPEGEINVLGAQIVPEVAIYLMIPVDGEPRLFVLPWDAEAASELQRAMEAGNGVKAKKKPKGKAKPDESQLEFHGTPQPAQPEKQPETSYQYERSE